MKYSALIGNPVDHSISPKLFELLANKVGIEYAHIKINVPTKKELSKTIQALCDLNFVGFNITCPYKIDMFDLLDDSQYDNEVFKINSINSVVINNGKMKGYNTDGLAAINSIKHFYKITSKDKVVILGAGGVAYPILYEIQKITKNIVIFNESLEMANKMCEKINDEISRYSLEEQDKLYEELNKATIIINATSVGMEPNSRQTLIDINKIKSKKCFFDVIFNPWKTKLLTEAEAKGHQIISGGYMLIYQAIAVLQLWLNTKINITTEQIEELAQEMIKVLEEHND